MMLAEQIRSSDISNEYHSFEQQYSGHNRICIDGSISGSCNCVGYCKYTGHPGFLTKKQRKEHNCLGKGCFYYVAKPKRDKPVLPRQACITDMILQTATAITSEMEGLKVLSARLEGERNCCVRYVTISNCYPIEKLENMLTKASGIAVKMDRINCDYERSVSIIFA